MSIAGIGSTAVTQLVNVQRNFQKVQSEFKQLGQDLQAGNLTQAQADFVTLSQSLASSEQIGTTSSGVSPAGPPNFVGPNALSRSPHAHSATGAHHSIHLRQALSQLGQALQGGNLAAAQQAFATMQQIWQQFAAGAVSGSAQSAPVNVNA